MLCHVDPDQLSSIQPNDDEGIEQAEANGWHNKQVHGRNLRRGVAQKRAPSLTWWSTTLDHVLGNARLRDFKAELEQFAVDARRSPQRVFVAHLPDQGAQLRADLRPPAPRA